MPIASSNYIFRPADATAASRRALTDTVRRRATPAKPVLLEYAIGFADIGLVVMSLRAVNLNLLPVLRALLRTRSVSGAAGVLAMSQSAASDALQSLRAGLKDPLLVRSGGHMLLTARASQLALEVESLCVEMEILLSRQGFNPESAERTFVIASSDYGVYLLAASLLAALAREGPNLKLRFVDVTTDLAIDFAERRIDFAFIPKFFLEDIPSVQLEFRGLLTDASVVLFRAHHPLSLKNKISQRDLRNFPLIVFHPNSEMLERKRFSEFLDLNGLDVFAYIPQITLLPHLLLDTDYLGIAPRQLSTRAKNMLPLESRPLAFKSLRVEMGFAWSSTQESDPAHRWFLELAMHAMKTRRSKDTTHVSP